MPISGSARSGGAASGEQLFWRCQWLAETHYPPARGQGKLPAGARNFYFTRLALLRQNPLALIEPDARQLPDALTQPFLALAPAVARCLALDFKRALRLLDAQQAHSELLRHLRHHALLKAPPLTWEPEHLAGIRAPLRRRWQALWSACWQQAEPDHLGRLRHLLRPDYLLVTAVAPPSMRGEAALKRLRQRLEQDSRDRPWAVPPPVVYCYDEPLEDWLLRPVLSGKWFFRLCQALAELTRAIPALIASRAAALGMRTSDAARQQMDTPNQSARRIPPMPQGSATAEAIFYYAVSAWRASAGEAGDTRILPDARRLSPGQFRELLALAVNAAERLLWDDSLALRALPAQTPERQSLLRRALLPPRLRRHYDRLAQKEAWRRAQAQAAPLPLWTLWETTLRAATDTLDKRLAASAAPADITSAALDALLRLPRTALDGQYLYQSSVGDWLRAALPDDLPGGDALLRFCQTLAEALGAWPPHVPGAPASAEQAGRAIFWFCKLALEACLDSMPGTSAPDQSAEPPQRQDGKLAVWLNARPLPPEALELATIIAPLVARVLYWSSWEAAKRDKPLFAARLKAEEGESVAEISRKLEQRARDINHPNISEAVLEAWEKLHRQLERLVLPDEISLSLLAGDRNTLALHIDLLQDGWYGNSRNNYQFLGGLAAFARSFIRPPEALTAAPLVDERVGDHAAAPSEASDMPLDLRAEDQAALQVLALIVQAAGTGAQPSEAPAWLHPADARLLIRALLTNNSGRGLVKRFARQGEPAAREIIRLWQASLPPTNEAEQEAEEALPAGPETEQMDQQGALAHLLAFPAVQRSPAMRRAVSDLFELPISASPTEQAQRLPLRTLERLMAWATRESLRAQALRALDALMEVPGAQRQALCVRLLAQEPIPLTLWLLEQSGWICPAWLRVDAPEAAEKAEPAWPDGDSPGGLKGMAKEESSPQLFLFARRSWQSRLSSSPGAQRAHALIAEWLGIHFWSAPWSNRPDAELIKRFYQTLMNALPPRLRAAIGAAWMVALEQKLAHLSELIGLIGCLPSQLPAQLDHRAFFAAMQERLSSGTDAPDLPLPEEQVAEEPQSLRRLRQDLRAARWRTLAWLLALAGIDDDNEQRVLLAAMSLVRGKAEQLERWLAGQPPSQAETLALFQEVKAWHHQTAITQQSIPRLLRAAAAQVRPAWQQLRRPPFYRAKQREIDS